MDPGAGMSIPSVEQHPRPELVVLDVNETLSDLSSMAATFTAVGLDSSDVPAWFAGVLRDAFALTVLGENPSFADVAASSVRVRLSEAGCQDPPTAAQQVVESFTSLDPHPDVVPGLRAIAEAGCRIVTLSNGSAGVARSLLQDTAAGAFVEAYLSVADAAAWKPDARAYAYALDAASVAADRAMLVAAHPWDIAGAGRAGLRTAWLNRSGADYPDHFRPPELVASSLVELAAKVG